MDRELIIRAAIHVGLTFELPPTKLIEFANLIAAAEREECMNVCEDKRSDPDECKDYEDTYADGWMDGCNSCAAAIRSRT
jgi:hypothetical protein